MEIFSAGTSGSPAEEFFRRLRFMQVSTVVDTRLNNVSQLAGFSKYPDFPFFLREIAGIEYIHEPLLAPERDVLRAYRAKKMSWGEYEEQYLDLMHRRGVAHRLDSSAWGDRPALLCSEATAERCHRRLAADYLAKNWGTAVVKRIEHL